MRHPWDRARSDRWRDRDEKRSPHKREHGVLTPKEMPTVRTTIVAARRRNTPSYRPRIQRPAMAELRHGHHWRHDNGACGRPPIGGRHHRRMAVGVSNLGLARSRRDQQLSNSLAAIDLG